MNTNTTITAIATPIGTGGIGVIRLSGKNALKIAQSIFTPFNNLKIEHKKAVFGTVNFENCSDNCLLLYFKAPHSFTGEDVVELQMHGGVFLLNETVKALIKNGATMAEPGEFSKRAVINGKMDITQAEALIDMINAQSSAEIKVASSQMRGELKQKLMQISNSLLNQIATIEVALDYPEHEEAQTQLNLENELPLILEEIYKLINTQNLGAQIKNGVNVALAGLPNVGKSSLLNALLGYDRAIVTNIEGTTRDTLCESYNFNGVRFNVTDTAGIRESTDEVEKQGVMRAISSQKEADIVLFLIDNNSKNSTIQQKNDAILQNLITNCSNFITVLNKSDIENNNEIKHDIAISAKNKTNIPELKQLIFDRTIDKQTLSEVNIITNQRHSELLNKAAECLSQAIVDLTNYSLDCVAVLVKQAFELIGQITGETTSEDIINTIFSKFCLGK